MTPRPGAVTPNRVLPMPPSPKQAMWSFWARGSPTSTSSAGLCVGTITIVYSLLLFSVPGGNRTIPVVTYQVACSLYIGIGNFEQVPDIRGSPRLVIPQHMPPDQRRAIAACVPATLLHFQPVLLELRGGLAFATRVLELFNREPFREHREAVAGHRDF